MTNALFRFALLLTILLSVTFSIQAYIQHVYHIGSFERSIILNYCFNGLIAIVSFAVLLHFKKKKSDQLGFIFLLTSMSKFVLFLTLIYPGIDSSNGLKTPEFASFFLSYGISTVLEMVYLIRFLKSLNQ